MSVKTMTARYPGVCANCPAPVTPGTVIRYAGKGMTAHDGCGDPAGSPARSARRRGRCEDAPCCGCC